MRAARRSNLCCQPVVQYAWYTSLTFAHPFTVMHLMNTATASSARRWPLFSSLSFSPWAFRKSVTDLFAGFCTTEAC